MTKLALEPDIHATTDNAIAATRYYYDEKECQNIMDTANLQLDNEILNWTT